MVNLVMLTKVINIDAEILGGTDPWFLTVQEFPSKTFLITLKREKVSTLSCRTLILVSREQVLKVLELSEKLIQSSSEIFMKILLDECVTKHLKSYLPDHEVPTVAQQGWSGIKNGQLMTVVCHRRV